MSTPPRPGPERAKKGYAKPVVRRVHLRPAEAVLAGCKSSGAAGPEIGACHIRGGGAPCHANAS